MVVWVEDLQHKGFVLGAKLFHPTSSVMISPPDKNRTCWSGIPNGIKSSYRLLKNGLHAIRCSTGMCQLDRCGFMETGRKRTSDIAGLIMHESTCSALFTRSPELECRALDTFLSKPGRVLLFCYHAWNLLHLSYAWIIVITRLTDLRLVRPQLYLGNVLGACLVGVLRIASHSITLQ